MNPTSKRLHLCVITRIDLSNNQLAQIPFTVFQIESLKFLKLSSNRLTQLPTSPNALDDKHRPRTTTAIITWACHNLEEAYFDNNQLTTLPFQLFQLRSLKHLNASNNHLQAIPEQLWSAPQLLELNVAHNRIQLLPLVSKQAFVLDSSPARTPHAGSPDPRPTTRSRKAAEPTPQPQPPTAIAMIADRQQAIAEQTNRLSQQLQISYEERPVAKANFWRAYSALDANATTFDEEEEPALSLKQTNRDFKLKYQPGRRAILCSSSGLRECPLRELNLSNNLFERVPECLSCMAPRLVKLNLSCNRLESMGAICDLPKSIKFLDLSHNSIKFSMRLLNEKLLLLLLSYLEGFCTTNATISGGEYHHILNQFATQTHLLLENNFCYQGLVNFLKESIQQQQSNNQRFRPPISPTTTTQRPKPPLTHKTSNNHLSNFTANRRGCVTSWRRW